MATIGSLFAGIGGFDLAFERAGVECKWQVECNRDALRVLEHHWPDVQRFDDVTTCRKPSKVDIVTGGFPCQDLSVAGKRAGLGGDRSGLFWQMVRIVDEVQPELCVWENVPGLLSSNAGRDSLVVLRAFADIGFHGGWRVLDAQHFALAQRRKRVFGVFARGRFGAQRAAEILALTEGRTRHPEKGRQARKGVAASLRSRSHRAGVNPPGRGGEDDQNLVAYQCHGSNVGPMGTIRAGNGNEGGGVPFIASTIRASDGHHGHSSPRGDGCDNLICGTLPEHHQRNTAEDADRLVVAFAQNQRNELREMDKAGALAAEPGMKQQTFVAYAIQERAISENPNTGPQGKGYQQDLAFTLESRSAGHGQMVAVPQMVLRRLMPIECLRLQGFPDWWLDLHIPTRPIGEGWRFNQTKLTEQEIKDRLSDSAKYRMIGNAVAVPVVEWIARRIATVLPGCERERKW